MKNNGDLERACEDYQRYIQSIFEPAMRSLLPVSEKAMELHHAFGATLFAAHAVDYLYAIRKADGFDEHRKQLVLKFDEIYGVQGARIQNRKFELVDAINNALKHIRLDKGRYEVLERQYGPISFRSLVEENGEVLCILEGFRFNYVRVVLMPVYKALTGWTLTSCEEVLEFARGIAPVVEGSEYDELMSSNAPEDAIDRMIEYCNPKCLDCAQQESECSCAEYVYEGEAGRFTPAFRGEFPFHGVMSQISGAYKP